MENKKDLGLLDIKRGDEGKNWFGRVIHRILNGGLNPRWVLDSRRVVTFEGQCMQSSNQ